MRRGGTRSREGVNVVTSVIFTCIRLHFVAASRFLALCVTLTFCAWVAIRALAQRVKICRESYINTRLPYVARHSKRPLLSATPSVAPSSSLSIAEKPLNLTP